MKAGGYILAFLLALFVVAVPYEMHAHWTALGPYWAATASFFVPGSYAAGDHVITPQTDVTITWQCSGAENIQIFSMLFATVFLMNWKRMQGWKSVLLYLGALSAVAIVNLARIITSEGRAKKTHYDLSNTRALAF